MPRLRVRGPRNIARLVIQRAFGDNETSTTKQLDSCGNGAQTSSVLPHLVNEQTRLELIEQRHARQLFDLVEANRKYLAPWMPWVARTNSQKDVEDFVDESLGWLARAEGFQTVIFVSDQLVGTVGFHGTDKLNHSASIGYWLDEGHQGLGIATACCRSLIAHGFSNMGLHRVEIRCATENLRSQAIPKRLGFSHEGTLREAEALGSRYLDHHVYGLLKGEWEGE